MDFGDEYQLFSRPKRQTLSGRCGGRGFGVSTLAMPALGPSRPAKEQGDQKLRSEGLPVRHRRSFLSDCVWFVK